MTPGDPDEFVLALRSCSEVPSPPPETKNKLKRVLGQEGYSFQFFVSHVIPSNYSGLNETSEKLNRLSKLKRATPGDPGQVIVPSFPTSIHYENRRFPSGNHRFLMLFHPYPRACLQTHAYTCTSFPYRPHARMILMNLILHA